MFSKFFFVGVLKPVSLYVVILTRVRLLTFGSPQTLGKRDHTGSYCCYFNNPSIIQITRPTFIPIVNPKFETTFPFKHLSTHHILYIQDVLIYNSQLQPINPTFSKHCCFIRKFTTCEIFNQNS